MLPVAQPEGDRVTEQWLPAGDGCSCLVNPNPWTYYGIPEPGGVLDPDPDCPKHFPKEARA